METQEHLIDEIKRQILVDPDDDALLAELLAPVFRERDEALARVAELEGALSLAIAELERLQDVCGEADHDITQVVIDAAQAATKGAK